ncbi:MAG: hypothetical protein ACREV9_18105 [Burkholderiales bacterium]
MRPHGSFAGRADRGDLLQAQAFERQQRHLLVPPSRHSEKVDHADAHQDDGNELKELERQLERGHLGLRMDLETEVERDSADDRSEPPNLA